MTKHLTRWQASPLAGLATLLLFGLPAQGAFPGCGKSLACSSFCSAWERCITGGGDALCEEEREAMQSCLSIPVVLVIGVRIDTSQGWPRPRTPLPPQFRPPSSSSSSSSSPC